MDLEERSARLNQVAALLPGEVRRKVDQLPLTARARIEELRLRAGQPLFLLYPAGEEPLTGTEITAQTLETVLEIASEASVHTVMEQIRGGFVSIKGGHRLGLCGRGVVREGVLTNVREISSLALRVAREFPGVAAPALPKLWGESGLESTLVLSPPGGGKTTFLRDLIRCLSAGDGCLPQRVGVADERGELAAVVNGLPTLSVGPRTDVMSGCPKELGMTALLRGMNPQVLAVDEITAPGDVAAMLQAAGCGVTLLATAHAASVADLSRRPLYRELMAQGVFGRLVLISGRGDGRRYDVLDEEGQAC